MVHREKGPHGLALSLGLVVLVALLAACTTGQVKMSSPCPASPCGANCSNQPFVRTDCWTTEYGPAKADIVTTSHNFLFCDGGSYALCYFSGPSTGNPPLPCTLTGETANCTCQVYTSGPYFVDINAILNLNAYYETVYACGADGSGCANLHHCGAAGTAEDCARQKPAPVCKYVRDQNPRDASVSLIPGADMVSAFSFAMRGEYTYGNTECRREALYAGCMTAPCFLPPGAPTPPSDGDPVQCQCPVFHGPYQVGQDDQMCTILPNVWSAAYRVPRRDQQTTTEVPR